MLQTPPGSRPASPVPVNTPVHRASRRIRGLPPDADVTLCTTSTGMTSTSVLTTPTGTESTMELHKAAAPPLPTVSSIASILKDELHQALRDPVTLANAVALPTDYRRATYAEALKRPASPSPSRRNRYITTKIHARRHLSFLPVLLHIVRSSQHTTSTTDAL
ncbi:hypothetical protein HPB52_004076 [Rhipicephalus sanguineus]|uniref:Uncharacterized protein n=1 Tax=Rhipicephalus sanguineus TaxID=34632 RepID=A0A9D4PVE4_RHISA|nr:hypothetical protein HPB52_004076 [Rhipicephalus sanguineus]